jgi:arylsulfatase A-like enzyme/tetratricopeptide (TPR) repeat protein
VRPWLVLLVLALVAMGSLGWWFALRTPAFTFSPNANRNVLLVTIDTLRADALSAYGGPAETPNIDRLAAQGARFTFAHAHVPETLPSHTSILTGRYPYQHGVRDNAGFRVPDGTVTIATRMKSLGFATGAFIGGFPLTKRFGLSPSFDQYDDQIPEVTSAIDFALPERRADVVVGRAVEWINLQQGKFFAWVHVFDPHAPYRPPPEYLERYKSQPYYGEVAWTDHALGPLFDRLATLPRPTLVIITADHGESLGEHGELTHGIFAYEATLHIPLIVAEVVPQLSRVPRGVVIDTPVRHVDIVPTILDSVGAPADATLPGRSLNGPIRLGTDTDRPEYFEAMMGNLSRGWAPLRGVLVGREKYIDVPIPELYDLAQDPHELKNLATSESDRSQVMVNTLRTYNTAAPNSPTTESPETVRNLGALGYVSSGPQPRKDHYTEADDPKRLIWMDQAIHRAVDLYETGHQQDGIAILLDLIKQRPDSAEGYEQVGSMYWETGQPDKAIAILETALKNGITGHKVPGRLATYLTKAGQAKRAITLLEKLGPSDVDSINALGMAYGDPSVGRSADAIAAFKHVLDLDPTNGLAYQNIAKVQLDLSEHDPRQLKAAEASLREAIRVDPARASAYNGLGDVLAHTGHVPDAIEQWKHAIEVDPKEFDALYNLVLTLGREKRFDEAQRYGQMFLATAPPAYYAAELARIRQLLGGGKLHPSGS